jgi:maleylacetoacetate isomerase
MERFTLDSFFRSSAAWRVRIALALKGIDTELRFRNFRTADQRSTAYRAINPQGLVPAFTVDGRVFIQSLAIIEYLDETHPMPPLLPPDAAGRADVRAMAQIVACDIHPINNLRVLDYLRGALALDDDAVGRWYGNWIVEGFAALETLASAKGDGTHCYGDHITLADICLVPQIYNARRFHVDIDAFPTLAAIDATLRDMPAFAQTKPENQPDHV